MTSTAAKSTRTAPLYDATDLRSSGYGVLTPMAQNNAFGRTVDNALLTGRPTIEAACQIALTN